MSTAPAPPAPTRRLAGWSLVAILLLALGVGLRLYRFPSVPAGLNQDEAAAGYEALSLLETGRDRWGNRLPPYFPAWGSGQSVLLSYLTVPFVAVLDLSVLSVRLPSLALGLLTLVLFYATVRRTGGQSQALVAVTLLALSPWHVMLSRWALDANLLPLTLLLGVFLLTRSFASESRTAHVVSLVPFALTFYSYALATLVTPLLVTLLLVLNRKAVARHWRRYLASAVIAIALSAPFGLVVFKNQIVKREVGIERSLPFDLPLLPASRLEQAHTLALRVNTEFLLSGLRDDLLWNSLPDVRPLPGLVLALALLGLVTAVQEARVRRSVDPFAVWLLAALPVLLAVPVNVTRANAFYLPLVALAARGVVALDAALSAHLRGTVRAVGLTVLLVATLHFARHYFGDLPRLGAQAFNRNLDLALTAAREAARPDETLRITEAIPLNYAYYLFFNRVPPAEFQEKAVYTVVPGAGFDVQRLGTAVFRRDALELVPTGTTLHVVRASEAPSCPEPEVVHQDKWWRVERCPGPISASANAPR